MVVAAVAALTVTFMFSSSAGAADPTQGYGASDITTTTVGPNSDEQIVLSKTDDSDSMVLSSSDEQAQAVAINKLGVTGTDSVVLAGIGVTAVAIGGAVLLMRRRVAA